MPLVTIEMESKVPLQGASFTIAAHPCCTPYSALLRARPFPGQPPREPRRLRVTIRLPRRSDQARWEGHTGFPFPRLTPSSGCISPPSPPSKCKSGRKRKWTRPSRQQIEETRRLTPHGSPPRTVQLPLKTAVNSSHQWCPTAYEHPSSAPTCIFRAYEPSRAGQLRHRPAP
jgi:hypothetical protein